MRIIVGRCEEALRGLPENSVDSVVCDPPYELGFMNKGWDSTGIANSVVMWREVLRVLKPGGHLLAFSGTRTYHRMACAIEDAGFEIRDQMQWLYGQGFPKSMDISKAIDKAAGAEREVVGQKKTTRQDMRGGDFNALDATVRPRLAPSLITAPATDDAKQWDGWGTALKPANEPICVARKPLSEKTVAANVLRWGTGAINIDASRVEYLGDADKASATPQGKCTAKSGALAGGTENENDRLAFDRPEQKGRWPANVIHDGSEQVLAAFPDAPGQLAKARTDGALKGNNVFGDMPQRGNTPDPREDSSKSAARFFYCAKASTSGRGEGNNHPTVKPVALMEYLVRLVTPPGGVVLDHFLGSGTTAVAAKQLGFDFIGIEQSAEYAAIAQRRVDAVKNEILDGLI